MKKDDLIIAYTFTFLAVVFLIIGFVAGDVYRKGKMSSKSIKVEYYVEIVSEDSIKVQSVDGRLYSGSFNDFEEIILKDNL